MKLLKVNSPIDKSIRYSKIVDVLHKLVRKKKVFKMFIGGIE